jgi:hypothetical protein
MPTPPVDLPREQKRITVRAIAATLVSVIVLSAATFGLPGAIDLPSDSAARFAFVVRFDLILGLWVVFAVRQVARIRFISAEDSRGSAYAPPSDRLAVPAAFLQNTLEQAFVAVMAHLAMATVSGPYSLAYVAGAVVLFCVGRVCFLAGYPKGAAGRAFGIVLTVIPTLGAYVWAAVATVMDLAS